MTETRVTVFVIFGFFVLTLRRSDCVKQSYFRGIFASAINTAFNSSRVKRNVEAQFLSSLYIPQAPPKQFRGVRNDIPLRVLNSKSGILMLHGTTNMIWRRGDTNPSCFKDCEQEQLINCKYYFVDTVDRRCLLLERTLKSGAPPIRREPTPKRREPTPKRREPTPKRREPTPKRREPTPKRREPTPTRREPTPKRPGPSHRRTRPSPIHIGPLPKRTETKHMQIRIEDLHLNAQSDEPDVTESSEEELDEMRKEIKNLQEKLKTSLKLAPSQTDRIHTLQDKERKIENTLRLLSERVGDFGRVNPKLVEDINTVDDEMESLSDEVDYMNIYENKMAKALSDVDGKITSLDSELTSLRLANDHLSRELSHDQMDNPEYEREINGIRRKLVDLMSRVEINPTIMKIVKNQRILGEALQSVDREIAVFSKRQLELEENSDDWGSRLVAQEEHRKTMSDVLEALSQALKDVRKDVANLQNPLSAENVQRTREMRQMRADIDSLAKSNSKLEQDVFHLRTDLTRLVKDLVNVQLMSYDSKASIMALVEANRNLRLDYTHERVNQNQMMTQIKTLSTVYRSVLAALHSLELKQIQVMHHLSEYENNVRRISSDLGDQKSVDDGSNLKAQIKHDLPMILDMRKLQIKLFKQVYNLKRQLFKIEREMAETKSSMAT